MSADWKGCVTNSWCATGGIWEASARDRKAARDLGGIIYEARLGQFRSAVYVRVVMASAPLTVQLLALRTSITVDGYREAAACRDAALLLLTDDLCPEKQFVVRIRAAAGVRTAHKGCLGFQEGGDCI